MYKILAILNGFAALLNIVIVAALSLTGHFTPFHMVNVLCIFLSTWLAWLAWDNWDRHITEKSERERRLQGRPW